MSANTILVFSENPALLKELLGKARQQADAWAGRWPPLRPGDRCCQPWVSWARMWSTRFGCR